MERSRRASDRQKTQRRSANERLKERWSACLRWSMIAAAVAHLTMFAAWPSHEVLYRTPSTQLAIAQLVPIASRGVLPPDLPVREDPLEEPTEVVPVESDDPLELIDLPPPSLAPVAPPPAPADSPPRSGMILQPRTPVRIHAGPSMPSFTWPELRNPRTVVRFLRTRYNPVALDSVPERYVSVAMGVDAKGVVEWAEVRGSSGHPAVDEIALIAINEIARFAPATRRGFPIPVAVVLSIPFESPW